MVELTHNKLQSLKQASFLCNSYFKGGQLFFFSPRDVFPQGQPFGVYMPVMSGARDKCGRARGRSGWCNGCESYLCMQDRSSHTRPRFIFTHTLLRPHKQMALPQVQQHIAARRNSQGVHTVKPRRRVDCMERVSRAGMNGLMGHIISPGLMFLIPILKHVDR